MTTLIHPENAEVAVEAARVLGLSNAGVDLITPDISRPWHENGGVINEVNFSPVLGVASISRGYLPEFLKRHIRGNGRIPVYALIGDERAERKAYAHHLNLCNQGLNACLIRAGRTQIGHRNVSMRPGTGPIERLRACLLRNEVDAVTFVVTDASQLKAGLPVDRFTLLTEGADRLESDSPTPAVSGIPEPVSQSMLSGATGRLS
jgi:cyanophycin synthetase